MQAAAALDDERKAMAARNDAGAIQRFLPNDFILPTGYGGVDTKPIWSKKRSMVRINTSGKRFKPQNMNH